MGGIVYQASGFVRTDMNAVPAAYTHIMVYRQLFPGAVHTVFYRAACYAGVTVDAFFLINPDYWR
jgi:hypothetical protein